MDCTGWERRRTILLPSDRERKCKTYKKKVDILLFETGFDQGKDVSALLEEQGYEEIQIKKDLAGLDRVVMGRYNKE